jgi:hypothetical protein
MNTIDTLDGSFKRYVKYFSWFSFAVPFIAYGLCLMVYDHPDFWSWIPRIAPMPFKACAETRRYGFLITAVIVTFILLLDIGLRRWRLVWLPLAGLAFAAIFYLWACSWTMVPIL